MVAFLPAMTLTVLELLCNRKSATEADIDMTSGLVELLSEIISLVSIGPNGVAAVGAKVT
jgi:hypothetical protein